jgi:hypothetical protein
MKKCIYCGLENADDAVMCTTCHTEFITSPTPLPATLRNEYLISPEEWRFWNRMTFRQFAVVMVRLAALWCFFEAALEATTLMRYSLIFPYLLSRPAGYPYSMSLVSDFSAPILRAGLCVVAGFILMFYPEKLLSWLVRGAVQRQPPEISPSKAPSTPPA